MDIDYKIIGRRIKEARIKKGISQERLSEIMDVSVVFVSRVERGNALSLKRLVQFSKILEVPLEYLISGTIPEEKNYLDKELYETLINCTPTKQRLIYNIAQIVSNAKFV